MRHDIDERNIRATPIIYVGRERKYSWSALATKIGPGTSPLYAVAYRPSRPTADSEHAETWFYDLALNQELPSVPLALRRGPTLTLALASAAYMEARERSRL